MEKERKEENLVSLVQSSKSYHREEKGKEWVNERDKGEREEIVVTIILVKMK